MVHGSKSQMHRMTESSSEFATVMEPVDSAPVGGHSAAMALPAVRFWLPPPCSYKLCPSSKFCFLGICGL